MGQHDLIPETLVAIRGHRIVLRSAILLTATAALLLGSLARGQNWQLVFDPAGNLQSQTTETPALPQILSQPQNQIVIPGEAASFSVRLADTQTLSYQWLFNGVGILGATNDALLLVDVNANSQGQFSVALANSWGSITSAPAALLVDSRGCGMPDSWQLSHFGNLTQNATGDFDGDGVSNLQEYLDGTDPANAASVFYRVTLFNDGGTVAAVPDQPVYTNGQVVTLTAIASETAPFHAWLGDVVTRSSSITLTMTNNKTLFALFTPITFQWTNTSIGDWEVASNWTPNLVPGSNDSVVIARAVNVTLNSDADLADFTLGGGGNAPQLTGAGTLKIRGTGVWVGGTFGGTGRTVIAPGALFTIVNAIPITLSGRTIENGGKLFWPGGGNINMLDGVITNRAEGQFLLGSSAFFSYAGGTPRFDNAGSFQTATTGMAIFSFPFNNYGTVLIQGGTLSLAGGGNAGVISVPAGTTLNFLGGVFTASPSSVISGPGDFMVSGGSTTLDGVFNVSGSIVFSGGFIDFTGNYTCTNSVAISSAVVSFDGNGKMAPAFLNLSSGDLGGSNTVTATGAMSWTGGSMSGSGRTVIPPGVTLTVASASTISITARTLDIGGSAFWSAANMFVNGGVITNRAGALFQIQNPSNFGFGGGSPRFDNAGSFVTGTTGTSGFSFPFNNYGTVSIQGGTLSLAGGSNVGVISVLSGTILNFAGGVFTASASSVISGAGNFSVSSGSATLAGLFNVSGSNVFNAGYIDFTGNHTCTNNTMALSGAVVSFDGTGTVAPAALNLSSGDLGGSNTVTATGTMSWTGGSMSGTGRTIIPPAATLIVASASSISITTRTLDLGGTTLWSAANMFLNNGVITNRAGALFLISNPIGFGFGGGSPRFDNSGSFLAAATGTSRFSFPFNNYGTVSIQGGTLSLAGGSNLGIISVLAGTTLDFAGGVFTGGASSIISGTGKFSLSGGSATLAGVFNVSGSNVFGAGFIDFTGNYTCTNNTLAIAGALVSFDGTGIVAPAILNLSSGDLGGSNTVTATGAMSWTGGSMSGGGRTVIPPGVTLTAAGVTSISLTARTLDLGGTALWSAAIMIDNGGVITNRSGALFQLQNSCTFGFGGGSPRFDNAGSFLTGTTGTSGFSFPFNNFGTVDLRGGFLQAAGGYVSASNAVLNCALSGTIPGANYGQLQVSGAVALKGTLGVSLANNYVPTTNDSFTVLAAGTRNGAFANFNYRSNLVSLLLSNTPTSVIVRVTAPPVIAPPLLLPLQLFGSNVSLSWTAVANSTYRVEFNADLGPFNWNVLPGDVTAVTNTASKLDTLTPSNRFYRIRVVP